MSNNKFIPELQKNLQAYLELSDLLKDITLDSLESQLKIKNLALINIQKLENKKNIIYFLREYINIFSQENKPKCLNQEKHEKDLFFLAYFLESIISEYGQDFVLTELLGKNPQRGVIESCKRALNRILRFLHIVKRIQEGRPENDDLFHGSFQRIVSSVQDRKGIIGQDILIKNKKFTKKLLDQIAKFLNFVSLEVKPEDRQVTIKDQNATNSDSSADSDFNSNSDSDADSVSDVDSDFDSNDSPLSHVNSIKSNNSDFSESLNLKQEKKEKKSKYSGHEERFYARQKNPNLRLKLQAKQEQLEEKLKYCQQRKSVYETLYKRYESYKDSNSFSKEELKDYEFKFTLNKKLYHDYEDYINQDSLSIMDHDSEQSRLLEYYKFKYSINKFKLDEYRSYIEKIENDITIGTISKIDKLLKTLGYYKEKCDKRYIPRMRDYELLMEAAEKKIENAHGSAQSKSPVVDGSQRDPIPHTRGMDTPVTGANEAVKGKSTNGKRAESDKGTGINTGAGASPPPTKPPVVSSKTEEQKTPASVGGRQDVQDELKKAISRRKEALEEKKVVSPSAAGNNTEEGINQTSSVSKEAANDTDLGAPLPPPTKSPVVSSKTEEQKTPASVGGRQDVQDELKKAISRRKEALEENKVVPQQPSAESSVIQGQGTGSDTGTPLPVSSAGGINTGVKNAVSTDQDSSPPLESKASALGSYPFFLFSDSQKVDDNQGKKPSSPKTAAEILMNKLAGINIAVHGSESETDGSGPEEESDNEWDEDKDKVPSTPANN